MLQNPHMVVSNQIRWACNLSCLTPGLGPKFSLLPSVYTITFKPIDRIFSRPLRLYLILNPRRCLIYYLHFCQQQHLFASAFFLKATHILFFARCDKTPALSSCEENTSLNFELFLYTSEFQTCIQYGYTYPTCLSISTICPSTHLTACGSRQLKILCWNEHKK